MGKTKRSIAGILCIVVLAMMFQICPSYAATATYSISKTKLNMTVGDTSTLSVSGTKEKISWSSSKKSVATVDQNGKVTAKNAGSAVITATVAGEKLTCNVTVENKMIRVLLKTTNFSGIYHSSVVVTSTNKFTIKNGKTTKKYAAGKKVSISSSYALLKSGNAITIAAENNGKISITSIKRSQGTPSYRGELTIKNVSGKGLTVVNKLPIEQYLYSVVSSEVSSYYATEAIKAQAVTARSYAYARLNSATYKSLGADVDDSTSYQVYNNIAENATIKEAVDATKNIVIKDGSKIIATFFFSTSFGQTAEPSEVWGGSAEDKYYNSVQQLKSGKAKNLSTNAQFKTFLKNVSLKTFDSNADWYRWNTQISRVVLQKQINNKLASCYRSYSSAVTTLQPDGTYRSKSISSIGTLKNVTVVKRTQSGMVNTIKITGSKAIIQVSNASAIRMLLAPSSSNLIKKNGSKVYGLSMLPSAFFYTEKSTTKGVTYINIYGGGYGHGVGMSQNGANQMGKEGYTYSQILKHYFKNIKVVHVAL